MKIYTAIYTTAVMVFTQGVSSFSFGSHERVVSPSKQPFAVEVEHGSKRRIRSALLTGLTGAIATSPLVAMADDYEIAELPPPYVPVAVAVVLLGGVGVLTSSLGDVLAEEASLGERSGAKAKKEMERSRSSYFKK